MKDFLIEIFAWWRGNTWGTRWYLLWHGAFVGQDEFGNRYYKSKKGDRRMVTYSNGYAEASMIPPGWHGWMHHRTDITPVDEHYQPRDWQRAHIPNFTGSALAYVPDGSMLSKGERPKVTGDYEAWSPE